MGTIIGRLACSLCNFENAHVKRNGEKLPYQHCPDCGAMLTTKSKHQARLMTAKMRPIDAPTSEPTPAPIETTATSRPTSPTPPVPPAAARAPKADFWSRMAGKVPQ